MPRSTSKARSGKPQPAGKSPKAAKPAPRSAALGPRAVHYRIEPTRPEAHLYTVDCTVADPSPEGETFVMPTWIPGSYMIRDFARNVVAASASADGRPVSVRKTALDRWFARPPAGTATLTLRIEVYAWDLSVRGAHLDATHGFFNGTSVFLAVAGRESAACTVEILPPHGITGWQVATTLPRAGATPLHAFGRYQAANYAELIDHPVETGRFERIEFEARGVSHEIALTGVQRADGARLARDLRKICAWQLEFWGRPFPVPRYAFLVTCVGEGYGGLEHASSTALLCRRDDLPRPDEKEISDGYRRFLGLASHEYFHTWLVKRIRPAEHVGLAGHGGPDLQTARPTEMLWLFEGFTAYYDDLAVLRAGVFSVDDYLAGLSKSASDVLASPGRFRQSIAEASHDAWIKYYRPDENSPNATVSYYAKGALVALALDLSLREATGGKRSLDDLMRRLWQDYGLSGRGVSEDDVRRIAGELAPKLAGKKIDAFFRDAVHGTADLPLHRLLASHGLSLEPEGGGEASLGVRTEATGSEVRIATALEGGAAQAAGLSGGDLLVAIDGLRATTGNIDRLLAGRQVGERVEIHAFRRDELRRFEVSLTAAAPKSWRVARAPGASKKTARLRALWLGTSD